MGLLNGEYKGFSRRRFALGSVAAAGAVAAATGLSACGGDEDEKKSTGEPQEIDDESIVSVLDDYKAQDFGLAAAQTWTLPLGTVLFHCEGSWAAAMLTPESALHPNTLGVLSLASGSLTTVREDAINGRLYTFFDVRCDSSVFAWVEIDYNTRDWKLYGQGFSEGALTGEPAELDSGNADWEPPMFTVAGDSVIWQKMPLASGSKSSSASHCLRWHVGDKEGSEIWESVGRFATHPRVSDNILTIVPRVLNEEGTYYGMTAIELDDDKHKQMDQLVLPASIRPFDAVYTGEQFVFSIEASYDYGGSLGNMGTYIGREGEPYVYFSREPAAWTSFNGNRFYIKTQSAHYIVDTAENTYDAISSPDHSLSFGDYPASEGHTTQFLVYSTVRDTQGIPQSVTARLFAI